MSIFFNYYLIMIFIFISLANVQTIYASEIQVKSETAIYKQFGDSSAILFKKFVIPGKVKHQIEQSVKQRFFRTEIYSWKVFKKNSLVGFALLDNVLGKAMPITFLVLFDTSCRILGMRIIKYRESIGNEISRPSWANQFLGLDASGNFNIGGGGIDGISGATVSVVVVSKGIHKLSLLLPLIKDEL